MNVWVVFVLAILSNPSSVIDFTEGVWVVFVLAIPSNLLFEIIID